MQPLSTALLHDDIAISIRFLLTASLCTSLSRTLNVINF